MEGLSLQDALEAQMRDQAEAGRLQDAEETAQLWEILCGVLDQFVEILGPEPMDLDEFTRLFRQILTQYSVGTIPVALDQVSVSEITRNDRHTDRYLFCWGPMTTFCRTRARAAASSMTTTGMNWPSGVWSWLPRAWSAWVWNCRISTRPSLSLPAA